MLDQNIRIFVRWVGIRFSILRFKYPSFFWTPGIPCETVLNLSTWLNICTSNIPFTNERHSCWPIACIYFMKSLLLWARLLHIYIWNNELKRAKDATCERTLCYHKTECDVCVFFVNCPEQCCQTPSSENLEPPSKVKIFPKKLLNMKIK